MADNTHSLVLAKASSQDARIADASQTGLDLTGNFTIEGFFQMVTAPDTTGFGLVTKNDTTGNNRAYEMVYVDVGGTKYIQITLSADGTSSNRTSRRFAYILKAGVWYHVAITCTIANSNATKFEFFINGVSQGAGTDTGIDAGTVNAIYNGTAAFIVGNEDTNAKPSDVKVNNLAVYNVVLTAAQIRAMAVDKTGRSGLKGWWKFNNSYADSSGNGNTLSGTNTPTFGTDVPFSWYTDAILDAVSSGRQNPGTSLTYSHTCSGSNRGLWVAVYAGSASDVITGVTYNGVAMTRVDAQAMPSSSGYAYLYRLIAPATGANNIVISSSSSVDIQSVSASYNEIKQSGQPDATGKASQAAADNVTGSVTTVTDKDFIVSMAANDQDNPAGGANAIMRKYNVVIGIGDSVGYISPAAATSWNWKRQGTGNCNWGTVADAVLTIVAVTSTIKKLSGVAQASVKKVSPTAIASVKKVAGVANV